MGIKRITVVYLPNSKVGSEVSRVILFSKVVDSLKAEGKEVKFSTFNNVSFIDGSRVTMITFGEGGKGIRNTHVYVDNEILELSNGRKYVEEVIEPTLITNVNANFDLSGDRISTYVLENNEMKIEKF